MDRKPLPDNLTVPEQSIITVREYEEMYHIISQDEEYNALKELSEGTQSIPELWASTKYDTLLEIGLAQRNSGAGNPYIQITSLGEIIIEHGPTDGIRKLIQTEHEFQYTYSNPDQNSS